MRCQAPGHERTSSPTAFINGAAAFQPRNRATSATPVRHEPPSSIALPGALGKVARGAKEKRLRQIPSGSARGAKRLNSGANQRLSAFGRRCQSPLARSSAAHPLPIRCLYLQEARRLNPMVDYPTQEGSSCAARNRATRLHKGGTWRSPTVPCDDLLPRIGMTSFAAFFEHAMAEGMPCLLTIGVATYQTALPHAKLVQQRRQQLPSPKAKEEPDGTS
jgi:hypothetical protein